jgi:predicted component of type VI protein secretion system
MAYLKLVYGPEESGKDEIYKLEGKDVFIIGRSQDADIKVMDIKVSRAHARIEKQGTKYYIVDNQSRNGCFLNGEKVLHSELKEGDHVKVGFSVMEFHGEAATGAAAPPQKQGLSSEVKRDNKPSIRRCYLCNKVLDDLDFTGGAAKEVKGRFYCNKCLAKAGDSAQMGLSSEAPPKAAEPKHAAAPQPPAKPRPGPTPPPTSKPGSGKGGGKLVDLISSDDDEEGLLPGDVD